MWNPINLEMCQSYPLHKGGKVVVFFTNGIAKMFEKLTFNQLSQYVNDAHILSLYQSGFRPNFSTTARHLKFTIELISIVSSYWQYYVALCQSS